ncbi:lantibiotic dehydratase C-terminal domain-containing protein [Thermopolyspora sp. NPDC052614]|uniref:lantibiotic dehydratase C-terminal domain-containing protein n=1 Tax=Thermopolyspora sp. NPDC052614 TaxID=3155682 RepID=UPI0034391530
MTPSAGDPGTAWVSVHAFHQGDLDALLRDGVLPLAERLAAGGLTSRWFYLRYWDGGPHLRVRAFAAPGHREHVRQELLAGLDAYLRANPSAPVLDAGAYRRMAAELARMEGLDSHETEPRPNDTAAEVPYVPERHVYGERDALAAVELHFAESSGIAARLVAAGTPPSRRRGLALTATLLALAVAEPDLDEAASRAAASAVRVRAGMPDLSSSYQPLSERLIAQAHEVWKLAGTGPEPDTDRAPRSGAGGVSGSSADRVPRSGAGGAVGSGAGAGSGDRDVQLAWLCSLRALLRRLEAASAAGDLNVEPPSSPFGWAPSTDSGPSAAVRAILMRVAHLFCNRLGVLIPDEMLINYLIGRTLTDIAADRESRTARTS